MDDHFRLRNIDTDHPALQITMPLVSIHDGDRRCIGTAFAVAPGLAITAAHVAEDWLTYQTRRDGYKDKHSELSVYAIQWVNGIAYEWVVDELYCSWSADIAFLRFQRPTWWGAGPGQVNPPYARLNFNPPSIGENLLVFGFPHSTIEGEHLYLTPSECRVRVRKVHLKTDIRMMPLSHFDVDGEILGGMSGGPCFDEHLNVIGVNSTGWDFDSGPPLSHIALLWPSMNVEIDLFKTGKFPAIQLFTGGPAKAVGYRRVYVSSAGKSHISKIDPDSLVPIYFLPGIRHVEGTLNFSASNAKEALGESRVIVENALRGQGPLDINGLHRTLRRYFGELDSALNISIKLAALQIGLNYKEYFHEWDSFLEEARKSVSNRQILDELALLNFTWYGVDLFEIRTYAAQCRVGTLHILSIVRTADEKVTAVGLEMCRKGGKQTFLPDGLDRFIESASRFSRRLLGICKNQENKREKK